MANEAVDITKQLSLFSEHWSPKVVARFNDYEMGDCWRKASRQSDPRRTKVLLTTASNVGSPSRWALSL